VPALEALRDEFAAAHFAVFGVSVDSLHCHANWGASLGGVSLPLLQDFHPKGAVGKAYGLYLDDVGIDDRATVLVDADGKVRYSSSVTPAGERNMSELLEVCRTLDRAFARKLEPAPTPAGLTGEMVLYVRNGCGFSQRTLNARANLHLAQKIRVRNVSEEPGALAELSRVAGDNQIPCLLIDGRPMFDSAEIIKYLVTRTTGGSG
jgi:hypothetical protein